MLDHGDQVGAGGADRRPASGGRGGRARPLPRGAARRVPGHQPRPAGAAPGPVRRRAPGDRGRRPVPVDLRLARRQRGQPAPVRARLPGQGGGAGTPGSAAVDQLPQHRPRPRRGRQAAGRASGRGARRAAAGPRARPQRPRPGHGGARRRPRSTRPTGSGTRRRRCLRSRSARRPTAGRGRLPAWGGSPPAPARPTSRCCAGSGRNSRRSAGRWRSDPSRVRWSAWADCCRSPRCRTWWPRCGCCMTPPRRTRWPGC